MKKVTKILTLLLVVAMAISMVACGSYGKVKKAFEKAGYTESEAFEGAASSIKAELGRADEENSLAVNFHFFSKGLNFALVIEFQATDDMIEAYKNSDTLKGLVKDVTKNEDAKAFYKALCEAGYANGNCFVVPISLNPTEIKDIVKKA